MENQEAISKLTDLIHSPMLSQKNMEFAASLIQQHMTKKSLSDKQWYWVERLVEEAGAPVEAMPTADVGDFAGVIALFDFAKSKLKWPKITLETPDGVKVQLSVSGPSAKHPGTVNVTDGRPYGQNTWYGRVFTDGTYQKSGQSTDALVDFLKLLSLNPAQIAVAYGHSHGHCCFCNTKLTAPNSKAAGFGPVCADNWGLKAEWKEAAQ